MAVALTCAPGAGRRTRPGRFRWSGQRPARRRVTRPAGRPWGSRASRGSRAPSRCRPADRRIGSGTPDICFRIRHLRTGRLRASAGRGEQQHAHEHREPRHAAWSRVPHFLQKIASMSLRVPHAQDPGGSWLSADFSVCRPFRRTLQLLLDLATDTRRRHRAASSAPRRAGAGADDISSKSFCDTLPMARSNSSSLIARSASILSRSSVARRRPVIGSSSTARSGGDQRQQHPVERRRHRTRGGDRQAEKNQVFGGGPAMTNTDRRQQDRREHEKVPRREASSGRCSVRLSGRLKPASAGRRDGLRRPSIEIPELIVQPLLRRGSSGGSGRGASAAEFSRRDQRNATRPTASAPVPPIR